MEGALQEHTPIGRATRDGALLAAVHAGDRRAFARLVDLHKDALVAYLTRLTGNPDDAEDLAQECFVRLYERSGAYREKGRLRGYLFRIATNLVRSRERQRRRRRILRKIFLAPSNGRPAGDSAPSDLLAGEAREQLQRALAELPLVYRTPLVLYEIEGWTYRRIGEVTGCREGTVKSRIHRGRRWLRERLEPYWHGGDAS